MAISQNVRFALGTIVLLIGAVSAPGQSATPAAPPVNPPPATPSVALAVTPGPEEDKRILGVLPNYRTAEMMAVYRPITARYKLKIAVKDSFDYPLLGVAAIYASIYHLEDSHPQFAPGEMGRFPKN